MAVGNHRWRLQVDCSFIDESYHDEAWPPAPAQVFQAFVWALRAIDHQVSGAEAALEWMEDLQAPVIVADQNVPRVSMVLYHRVNMSDQALLRHECTGGGPIDRLLAPPVGARTNKALERKTTRWFPQSPCSFQWNVDEAQARRHLPALQGLARHVVRIGRSEDFVLVTVILVNLAAGEKVKACWRPARGGTVTRSVPMHGRLESTDVREAEVRRRAVARVAGERGIRVAAVDYRFSQRPSARPFIAMELVGVDGERMRWPSLKIQMMAAMVRHALGEALPRDAGFVTGHAPKWNPDWRMSWVPLPSVGHEHVDGDIRRLMLLGPDGMAQDDPLWRRIEQVAWELPLIHRDSSGKAEHIGSAIRMDRLDGVTRAYRQESTIWQSVTPVILKGRTTKGGSRRGKLQPSRVEKLVNQILGNEMDVSVVRSHWQMPGLVHGSSGANDYWFGKKLLGYGRVHLRLETADPIAGPLVLGVGKHQGFGLMLPVVSERSGYAGNPGERSNARAA